MTQLDESRCGRLSLTRRRGQMLLIHHSGRSFSLEVGDVHPTGVKLALRTPEAVTLETWMPRRDGEPFTLNHLEGCLKVLVKKVEGSNVNLVLEGPLSFTIERDDARTKPRTDEQDGLSPCLA